MTELADAIRRQVRLRFPVNSLGFLQLDDDDAMEASEHLAWYLLKAGASLDDIVDNRGNDDETATKAELFANLEWHDESSRIFRNEKSLPKLHQFDDRYSSITVRNSLRSAKQGMRLLRQLADTFARQMKEIIFDKWRPELAIHEIRPYLLGSNGDDIRRHIRTLAFLAAAELGDVDLVRLLASLDSELLTNTAKDYHNNLAVHHAAMAGQLLVLEFLIGQSNLAERGVDSFRGFNNRTALIWAARNGETEIVDFLLRRGANPRARSNRDDRRWTACHAAAKYGHLEALVRVLVEDRELVDCQDDDGYSAIHYAAAYGHIGIVRVLIENFGQEVDRPGYLGRTPLMLAAMGGWLETAQYLLIEKSADPSRQTVASDLKANCLHFASIFDREGINCLLLSNGDEKLLETRTIDGATALEIASDFGNVKVWSSLKQLKNEPIEKEEFRQVLTRYLARSYAKPLTLQDQLGKLAFETAIANNDFQTAECLITSNKTSLPGEIDFVVALGLAAEKGILSICRYLIEKEGVSPDERRNDEGCRTPLIAASSTGALDVVRFLVGKGAQVTARSWDYQLERCERTAIHVAANKGHADVVELLLSEDQNLLTVRDGAGDVALRYAARSGQIAVLKVLIEKYNQNVDSPSYDGLTALMYAASAGQRETVDYLLEKGADPLVRTLKSYHEGGSGFTAVHFACRSGNVDIVETLLSKCPQLIDVKTDDGRSLLHWASRCGLFPLVRHLVDHGKDVNARGYKGRTPLMEAASIGSQQVVEYLLSKGADLSARSWDEHAQMTALCFCFQDRDQLSTADLLLSRGASLPLDLYNYLMLLSPHQASFINEDPTDNADDFERLPGNNL